MYNNYYHGSGNLQSIKESGFLKRLTGLGNNTQGAGFYFTNSKDEAGKRYTKANINETSGKIGGASSPGVVTVNLKINNPIKLPEDANGLQDAEIKLTANQAFSILSTSSLLHVLPSNNKKTNPLADYFDEFNTNGPDEDMIYSLSESSCQYIEDLYPFFEPEEYHKINTGIKEQLGYDGVMLPFNDGTVHLVAWFSEQVEIIDFDYTDRKENNWSYVSAKYKEMVIAFRVSTKKLNENSEIVIQRLSDFIGEDARYYDTSEIYSDIKSLLKNKPAITVNDAKEIESGNVIKKYDQEASSELHF